MEKDVHNSAQRAVEMAAKLGLPEGSSWGDINAHNSAKRHIGGTALNQ